MIIIADCGSTKIDWVLLDRSGHVNLRATTAGYNAVSSGNGELETIVRNGAGNLMTYAEEIGRIEFYGAGCGSDTACTRVRDELHKVFGNAECEVASDMLAAARALCGDSPGIAAILGTGSNSCLYDGTKIVANVSPLGFILGDEGSGAVLGCKLLGGILKRQFSAKVRHRFSEHYPNLRPEDIIEEVYRGKRSRAFLASFAPFLSANIDIEEIDNFVTGEFESFFRRNVCLYRDEPYDFIADFDSIPVNFTGSIAQHFQPQLRKAAEATGCKAGCIIKAPIDKLIERKRSQTDK